MGVPCRKDSCNRTFDSQRAMKQHHYGSHGEKIGKREVTCEWCGERFSEWESELNRTNRTFCSNNCFGKWQSNNQEKENNPNWMGGRRNTHTCEVCGDTYKNYKEADKTRCCTKECYIKILEERTGEDCPSWKGGSDTYYGSTWPEKREEAIQNAGNSCERCGINRDEHKSNYGKDLHVHHIKPYRMFDNDNEAHRVENLVAACQRCHKELEKESIERFKTDTNQ